MAGENIGFVIPANYLTDFGYPSHPQVQVAPDKNISSKKTSSYIEYSSYSSSQRTPIGINPIKETLSVNFSAKNALETSYIEAFFKVNKGIKTFSLYIPYEFSYRTTGQNTGTTTLSIVDSSPLYDIYPDAIVTSDSDAVTITAGTKIVTVNSPISFTLNNSDFIPNSSPIRITNVKKEIEVRCIKWNTTVRYRDLYNISAEFERVYSAKQAYKPIEGDTL